MGLTWTPNTPVAGQQEGIDVRAAPLDDFEEHEEQRSLWARFKDRLGFGEDFEEEIVEEDGTRRPVTFRVHSSRTSRVTVWLAVNSLNNAKDAADGLKQGRQEIVNLEKASQEICTRVIDFLSGVTYALDGTVEKVGERVYLFTPANVVVDVENAQGQPMSDLFGSPT